MPSTLHPSLSACSADPKQIVLARAAELHSIPRLHRRLIPRPTHCNIRNRIPIDDRISRKIHILRRLHPPAIILIKPPLVAKIPPNAQPHYHRQRYRPRSPLPSTSHTLATPQPDQ